MTMLRCFKRRSFICVDLSKFVTIYSLFNYLFETFGSPAVSSLVEPVSCFFNVLRKKLSFHFISHENIRHSSTRPTSRDQQCSVCTYSKLITNNNYVVEYKPLIEMASRDESVCCSEPVFSVKSSGTLSNTVAHDSAPSAYSAHPSFVSSRRENPLPISADSEPTIRCRRNGQLRTRNDRGIVVCACAPWVVPSSAHGLP